MYGLWGSSNIDKHFIRDDTHMTSMKIVQFLRVPLSIYIQNSSTSLTLDVQFQKNPPSLQVITNQLKENKLQRWLLYVSNPCFRSAFVFSVNSLILSGFLLTTFDLDEASLSAYSWLYTLASALVQNYL